MPAGPTRILFLCTGNSCRSQMAEGWCRALRNDYRPSSAGLVARGVDPRAVRVMREAGVDIEGQVSTPMSELLDAEFDLVVTVCDHARESCPHFPGATRVVHVGFDDPPALAAGIEDEALALAPYRRVRDELRSFVEGFPETLDGL